jgi:hypothetical protein
LVQDIHGPNALVAGVHGDGNLSAANIIDGWALWPALLGLDLVARARPPQRDELAQTWPRRGVADGRRVEVGEDCVAAEPIALARANFARVGQSLGEGVPDRPHLAHTLVWHDDVQRVGDEVAVG